LEVLNISADDLLSNHFLSRGIQFDELTGASEFFSDNEYKVLCEILVSMKNTCSVKDDCGLSGVLKKRIKIIQNS